VQCHERDQHAEVEMPGCVHKREAGDENRTCDVGTDEEQTTGIAIGEDAADQQRRHETQCLDAQDDPERARLVRQSEGAPAKGDDEGRIADLRDGLTGEEKLEVAMPKCLEETQARPCGRRWFHVAEAILRVCRTRSASPASR
jgi:hypothetical protein